jgi:CRP/FNR family cyclic AMP-dependent transcriptional regulator
MSHAAPGRVESGRAPVFGAPDHLAYGEDPRTVARDEYQKHLASVPLFSTCTKAQLQEIGRLADEVTVPAGHVLARQGDAGVELFIIVSGEATVTRDGAMVATLGPGAFVGELAVLTHAPRNADVVAATELDILVLTRGALGLLLDDVPGLAKQLLYAVLARLVPSEHATGV